MNLLKNLSIKTSLPVEHLSSNKEEKKRYCIKCLFPDEDMYCYVLSEYGFNRGKVKVFNSIEEVEEFISLNKMKNTIIEPL